MSGDIYWSNVSLGLHLDGSNGSTTFTDEKGHTVTPSGNAAITTAQFAPLTGNAASASFDGGGTNPQLLISADSGFNSFGTGDFSIEFWMRIPSFDASARCIASVEDSGGTLAWFVQDNSGYPRFVAGAALNIFITSSIRLAAAVWSHVSICRASGVTRLFVDGVLGASHTGSIALSAPTAPLRIGRTTGFGGSNYIGLLDDFEITAGVARRTSGTTFARPTIPFEHAVPPPDLVTLPLRIESCPMGSAALPLSVSVIPAAILAGTQAVSVGVGAAASTWIPVVRIGGVDKSSQVIGEIMVDAEEGAARIAELTLRPPTGTTLNLAGWTGLPVEIDIADNSTGTARYAMRLFTGVIDTPTLDQSSRTLGLRCTDDLQGRCLSMSSAALIALIGGYHSPAVFDAAADGWTLAQDRLSTVSSALDIDPYGALRVTPWAAKPTADLTFTDTLLGDEGIAPTIADRASLTNEVVVDFGYRYPRLKVEAHNVQYDADTMTNFGANRLANNWFMQRSQVEAAISKAGGTLVNMVYVPLPTVNVPYGSSGLWTPGPFDSTLCMGFSAMVTFDFAQTTEEQFSIAVRNPLSIAAVGLRSSTLSGALEGAYPDLVATETTIKTYKDKATSIPPADLATPILGETTSVTATLSAETNRAAANTAMETLIAIAKGRIAASHRRNSVSGRVPLMPVLDLDKTIHITADGVDAKGKVRSVVHRMNAETGLATSEFSIAISALSGVGVTHASDPTTAPAGATSAATLLSTSPTVTFNSGPTQDHVITVTFPAIAAAERNNAVVPLASVINAPIAEDLFTVTL